MTKISDEDLKELNDLRSSISNVVGDAGQTTLQIKLLQEDIKLLENKLDQDTAKFKKLIETEQELVKRLSEKYGTGSIDFETGEFTPEK